VGRGYGRIRSNGVADTKDPAIQMQAKYPPRVLPMPASLVRGQAVENLRGCMSLSPGWSGACPLAAGASGRSTCPYWGNA
jgi:hypothetical protein